MMSEKEKAYIGVREDFFTTPLYPLEQVSLSGSRCRKCGEVFLGRVIACQNCQGQDFEKITLSRQGKLYTYTIARHKPPGNYKGPDPFEPFAAGMVELPEGVRVLAPITGCEFDRINIGMELELVVEELYTNDEGQTVLYFSFRPAGNARS